MVVGTRIQALAGYEAKSEPVRHVFATTRFPSNHPLHAPCVTSDVAMRGVEQSQASYSRCSTEQQSFRSLSFECRISVSVVGLFHHQNSTPNSSRLGVFICAFPAGDAGFPAVLRVRLAPPRGGMLRELHPPTGHGRVALGALKFTRNRVKMHHLRQISPFLLRILWA